MKKNELADQIDSLIAAIRAIPRIRDTTIEHWIYLFDNHWLLALQKLEAVYQGSLWLVPEGNTSLNVAMTYNSLSELLQGELSAGNFDLRIGRLAKSFAQLNRSHFSLIEDDQICKKLSEAVLRFATVANRFHADFDHARELAEHPQHIAPT
ncbi:MAG: hypothetical protein M3R00_02715 [Pseudomonadota bacterium]|nr:hypothetical protein [Pseudomonadota bacterium]